MFEGKKTALSGGIFILLTFYINSIKLIILYYYK